MMCHDVLLTHECLAIVVFVLGFMFRVCIPVFGSCLFAIHDMIGRGVTWGDVTMNSFTFTDESRWCMIKSVTFLELL